MEHTHDYFIYDGFRWKCKCGEYKPKTWIEKYGLGVTAIILVALIVIARISYVKYVFNDYRCLFGDCRILK
jgi:hypothetical protein